jgi:hypothetical protein
MEYVEGETLAARLRRGRLEIKEALPLALEIAEALGEAHRRRILHRDLKPSNIMLTAQGHVKVMDFGLARRFPAAGVNASQAETMPPGLTGWGMQLGTPAYMSPEQALAAEVDERSDLFTFGIVLYELLAGTHPFDRGSPSATLAAIVRESPPPLTTHLPDVPASVEVMIGKLLAKNPADRYQSFGDVCADLRRLREELSGRLASSPTHTAATAGRARAATRTPYVGRAAERAELWRLLDRAAEGAGTLVLIGGEPGVGKTRLTEEVARRGASARVPVARGPLLRDARCAPVRTVRRDAGAHGAGPPAGGAARRARRRGARDREAHARAAAPLSRYSATSRAAAGATAAVSLQRLSGVRRARHARFPYRGGPGRPALGR